MLGPNPDSTVTAGTLLIAAASLPDSNFSRSVVLICDNHDQGAFGLVLNQPIPLRLSDGVSDLAGWDAPLFRGGPVQQSTLHFLHRCPFLDIGSREVMPGLYLGGDFDRLNHQVKTRHLDPDDFRFFIGYSGWGKDQLEDELERDSWYTIPATMDLVFTPDVGNLWRETFRGMGDDYTLLSNFPDDPRWN